MPFMAKQEYSPDWDNSDRWTEHQWEQALKYSDGMAARYFRMLDRFGDLPDAEELIAARLGDQQLFELDDGELDHDWIGANLNTDGDVPDDDSPEEIAYDDRTGPGDSFYFETRPVYQRARQVALGWCNILASVLRSEDRFWGLKILFHMGRVLSYLALSVGDGTYERASGSIAFAKRALAEVNTILGEIDNKVEETPKYATMFKLIRELLLDNRGLIVNHLVECRSGSDTDTTDSL